MLLIANNWWAFLIRGILALIFGIVALFFPAAAFLALVFVFGAFDLPLWRHLPRMQNLKIGGGLFWKVSSG